MVDDSAASDPIRFLLNGEPVTAEGLDPTRSVLSYLREDRRCTGTKEGCAEGDCGACTVVVAELDGDRVRTKAVNACIQFVPTLDGTALFTVEYLRRPNGGLHPAQQALVDCHGSQCGFCTPGFVMSLWCGYLESEESGTRPDREALRTALSGNLCRCTGYRPILDAGDRMFDLPKVPFQRTELRTRLESIQRPDSLFYQHRGTRFHAPTTVAELVRLRADHPEATVLAGCTDIGLWVNKQFRELGDIIYIGAVAELREIRRREDAVRIGAGASLTDAYGALVAHYPEAREMWERFASVPIRNAGTLGGNIANGSPIGDSMPWLIAVGARVVLRNVERARTLPMEDLYVDYMKKSMLPDEIVEAVEVPLPAEDQRFRTYKLSKRYDSDISAVCAAFSIRLDGERIRDARVAFGGLAATPKRAPNCEAALSGQMWTEMTMRTAMKELERDYTPLSDMRASADYRARTAANLLHRFYLETRPDRPVSTEAVSVFATA
jgi:xanthine dehydrogenase small subunit